jgi:hypothetical protein
MVLGEWPADCIHLSYFPRYSCGTRRVLSWRKIRTSVPSLSVNMRSPESRPLGGVDTDGYPYYPL